MAYSRVTTTIVNLKHLLFSRSEVLYLFFDEVHLHSKRLYSHFFLMPKMSVISSLGLWNQILPPTPHRCGL